MTSTPDSRFDRDKAVAKYLPLVVSVARNYQGRGLPLDDLIQEGILGLLQALDRFDPSKGFQFITYATRWIRAAVGRAVSDKGRMIRLPVHVFQLLGKVNKERADLAAELGREPTIKELARVLRMPESALRELERLRVLPLSLDVPVSIERPETLAELLPSTGDDSPESQAMRSAVKDEIRKALARLTDREREVIIARYGLDGTGARTLDEVETEVGVSRSHAGATENRALEKLSKSPSLRQLVSA
jgi:RNA polymerase primary sigma factor